MTASVWWQCEREQIACACRSRERARWQSRPGQTNDHSAHTHTLTLRVKCWRTTDPLSRSACGGSRCLDTERITWLRGVKMLRRWNVYAHTCVCVCVGRCVCVCVQSSGFFSGTELWLSFQMNQSMAIQFRLWGKGASIQAWGFPHMVIGFQKEKKKKERKPLPALKQPQRQILHLVTQLKSFRFFVFTTWWARSHVRLISETFLSPWRNVTEQHLILCVCVCVCVCVCPYVCVFRLTVKGILEVEWCTKSVERHKWTQTDTFALVGTEWCGHTSVRVENPSSSVKSSHFTHRCVTECSVTRGKGRETWGEMTEVWVSGKFSDQSSDSHTHTS